MTFEEALAFWYNRINYEVKSARPADLKLEHMSAFLDRLGRPHDRLRVVHVTGTKGKGSTVALIASVLQEAGYRVGQFTSPHLESVTERIRVNNLPITENELAELISEIVPVVLDEESQGRTGPTFFEIGTALGFLHFVRRRVDLAIVEVGMGGRFDSTNVCLPLVSVITSIGLDHMAQLGRTLGEIAFQKGGIIKRGVPVVCGSEREEPRTVIESIAQSHNAPLRLIGTEFAAEYRAPDQVRVRTPLKTYPWFKLKMPGAHQAVNTAVALATIEELQKTGLFISPNALQRGIERTRLSARIESIHSQPAVILDSAHNVPSAQALVRTLKELYPSVRRAFCVFAVSSDKQYSEVLSILSEYFDEFYLTKYSNNSRGVSPEQLQNCVVKPSQVFESAGQAWDAVARCLTRQDLVCVTGSIFLAGELSDRVRNETFGSIVP